MRLVEQHTIKPSSVYYNELYDLLHKCKNLYNKGLYVVRQHYFQYKDDNTVKYKYLNYYSLEKKLRAENDVDYRALPAPVAQQVLMMVDRNFKSFFNLFNKKNRGEYSEEVRMPRYLNKGGLFPIEEKYFQKRQKQKKGSVFFYSFKTLPINKLKKIYHILKIHF